ncbi:MAG: hypothetical protein K2I80_07420 [Ruminococcus sp.]|nr:hypothetical protein [Ruminococcus sp.]
MTIDELKVKNWMNRAFYAEKKVNALDMLIKQCRERAERLAYGEQDTALNGTESTFMKLLDMKKKYSRQKSELVKITDEVSNIISELHDDDLETVLIHRYLLFHTIEQTAEFMHYSPETVKRKQKKAIEKLTHYDLV